MLCSNCGTQLPNDAKVCPTCGTPAASGEANQHKRYYKLRRK